MSYIFLREGRRARNQVSRQVDFAEGLQ